MKRFILALLVLTMLTPAAAFADRYRGGGVGGYAGILLGVNMGNDIDITDNYYVPAYVDRLEFDPGVYVGGTIGSDFGPLRLEGEISYRGSDVDSITFEGDSFPTPGGDGSVGALAVMFNAFLDLETGGPVTPYIGGGIGFANLSIDDVPYYNDDDDGVFAYQLGGGLAFNIQRNMTVDIGYRFFGTSDADFEYASMDYQSHTVMLGFRFLY